MSGGKTFWRRYGSLAPVMTMALALSGCTDVKNFVFGSDDTPANAPNAADLQNSATKPYPNLASVPNPPTNAPTAAQKAAMVNGLIADRSHALYADNQVRSDTPDIAAMVAQTTAPQDIPMQRLGRPGAALPQQRVASAAMPGDARPRPVPVSPVRRGPLLGPPIASQAPPPVQAQAPVQPVTTSSGLASGGALGAPAPAPAAPATNPDSGLASGGALSGDALPTTPRATPQPQTTQAPPPPPNLPPSPAVEKSPARPAAAPAANTAANNAPATAPAAAAVPEQVGALPTAPALGSSPSTAPAPAATTKPVRRLGSVSLKSGSEIGAGDPAVAAAASAFKQQGGKLRVVGYAPATNAADATSNALSGAQAALANAAAVKKALVAAGVPAGQIVTEAGSKPADAAHADILLAP